VRGILLTPIDVCSKHVKSQGCHVSDHKSDCTLLQLYKFIPSYVCLLYNMLPYIQGYNSIDGQTQQTLYQNHNQTMIQLQF